MIKIYSWKKAFFTSLLIHLGTVLLIFIGITLQHGDQEIYVIDLSESITTNKEGATESLGVGIGNGDGTTNSQGRHSGNASQGIKTYVGEGMAVKGSPQSHGHSLSGEEGMEEHSFGDDSGGSSSGGDAGGGKPGIPFDREGFRVAITAHKKYPLSAIKRGITGTVYIETTLDANGNCLGVSVIESSGSEVLDNAGVKAAEETCPYPNASGHTVSITTPVIFRLE
ncbi:energy transducer TonB family protein [Dialister pneumosintes]|uniref:TonB C-terminal domain-containing protein n=1 Tax=Dialister pneumosintes TaxID=39950 RepID=A0A1B3WF18_9FIRM|nr:TonB family protein [Dialister pneumosintes]AOH39557.1 hypothetical protein BCB69_06115 [Dialister pneumosintes]MBS6480540.1 energy transducer TonB [Dialister sp.]